jgi:hypothetical protein
MIPPTDFLTQDNGECNSPLKRLVKRLQATPDGDGSTFKALCPAHNDKKPSLSLSEGTAGNALVFCHADCSTQAVLDVLGLSLRDLYPKRGDYNFRENSNKRTKPEIGESPILDKEKVHPVAPTPTSTFGWQSCVKAFTGRDVEKVVAWRGYTPDFVRWLKDNNQIGIFANQVALPVASNGQVVGAHYKTNDGWRYTPVGLKTTPLVIGAPEADSTAHIFESEWDAFAYMDISRERDGVVATRGAGNGKLVAGLIPDNTTAFAWVQNDDPGTKWLKDVRANTGATVKVCKTPARHKDVNDWLRAGATVDDLVDAMVKAEVVPAEEVAQIPVIEDVAEVISKPIALPPDVIEGVLHRGGKMVLGGASKSYKTWLLMDVAVSIATGTPCLNGYATKKGRVLYVNFELPAAYCAWRFKTICDERQVKLEPGMLKAWNLRGHASNWTELQKQIPAGEFSLVVTDPAYKLLSNRDENKAGDIASLMNEFESVAVRTGAAVAFGAHYSKGNQSQKESIDRIGGSGVFARDPDTILNFTRHEQDDCFVVEATLRNHPPIKPFVMRWEYPLFAVDALLDPVRLRQAGRPPAYNPDDVLDLIDGPMTATQIVKAAGQELGIDRRRVFELLNELKRTGRLKQPEKRGAYERI